MGNPPPAVKLALESICLLLGEKATDWRAIRGVIIKDNFISTVVNFSTEDISYVVTKTLVLVLSVATYSESSLYKKMLSFQSKLAKKAQRNHCLKEL